MFIFSKWRILFSSLVLLKIIKAVTECIFSIVIKVCDELEFFLKSDENSAPSQNVLPRMKINSINHKGSNYTRSQVSYSVNRNLEPDSVGLLISNLPTGKNVTIRHINRNEYSANVTDVTYDDLNNIFQRRALSVKCPSVCLKPDNTFPRKILESSTPLDLSSRESKSGSKQPEINVMKIPSEFTRSLQNAEQVMSPKISNASSGSSYCKQNISDRVDVLVSNESNNSENSFSKSVSFNAPQQIVKYTHKTPSSDSADLPERNLHQENNMTQTSEKPSFIHDKCISELVTAVHKEIQCHDNVSKNLLDDIEKNDHIQRNKFQEFKQVEETKEDVKLNSPKVNAHGSDGSRNTFPDDELKVNWSSPKVDAEISDCSCKTLDEDEFIEHLDQHNMVSGLPERNVHQENKITQSSEKPSFIHDECPSELVTVVQKEFQCHDKASINLLDDFEKNDHIQRNNCQKFKQVEETRDEVTLNSLKVNVHGSDGSRNTFPDDELKVNLSSPKVDAELSDCSSKTLDDDEFIEHLEQHNMVSDFFDDETDGEATDGCTPSSADTWLEQMKTGKPAYTDFLKEMFPLLEEIEMEILKLCKEHYCKTLMSRDELKAIDLKLVNVAHKSIDVNTIPYHGTVRIYINEVVEILALIQKYLKHNKDPNTSNAMKRSVFLKKISRALAEERDQLFQANDDTRALRKQFQEAVYVPWRNKRNKRRRK